MNKSLIALAVLVVVGGLIAVNSLYIVSEKEQALVLQFGNPVAAVREPGLQTKVPFIQNVVFLDKRILDLDSPAEEVIASDQKRVVVDAFARFRIADPLLFYQTVGTPTIARSRLESFLNTSLRNVLGKQTFFAVLSGERSELMGEISREMNQKASELGIEIVDVRIRRADLPEENSQAVFRRMQTEREREASEFRAQGREFSQRIRSRADREATVLKAEAQRDADIKRGEGDALRNKIFADAYGKDVEFFDFYRSMKAYETALASGDTTMVLSPESDFFRYFGGESPAATKAR